MASSFGRFCMGSIVFALVMQTSRCPGQSRDVKGQVSDAVSGQPIAGTLVQLKDKPAIKALSMQGGVFVLKEVPSGIYTVIAQDNRYLPAAVENYDATQTSAAGLSLQLYPRQLAISNGRPYVNVDDATAGKLLAQARAAGDLQAIFYLSNTLAIHKPEDEALRYMADNAKEQLAKRPGYVAGKVVNKDGTTALNAKVTFLDVDSGESVTTQAIDGSYEVSLFPGRYTVSVAEGGEHPAAPTDTTSGNVSPTPGKPGNAAPPRTGTWGGLYGKNTVRTSDKQTTMAVAPGSRVEQSLTVESHRPAAYAK